MEAAKNIGGWIQTKSSEGWTKAKETCAPLSAHYAAHKDGYDKGGAVAALLGIGALVFFGLQYQDQIIQRLKSIDFKEIGESVKNAGATAGNWVKDTALTGFGHAASGVSFVHGKALENPRAAMGIAAGAVVVAGTAGVVVWKRNHQEQLPPPPPRTEIEKQVAALDAFKTLEALPADEALATLKTDLTKDLKSLLATRDGRAALEAFENTAPKLVDGKKDCFDECKELATEFHEKKAAREIANLARETQGPDSDAALMASEELCDSVLADLDSIVHFGKTDELDALVEAAKDANAPILKGLINIARAKNTEEADAVANRGIVAGYTELVAALRKPLEV